MEFSNGGGRGCSYEQHFCEYFGELVLLTPRARGLVSMVDDSRKSQPLASENEPPDVLDSSARLPEAQLASEEPRMALRTVITEVTSRDRDVLATVFRDEEEQDRVCAQLGVTKDYLRVLLHQAKKELEARHLTETDRAGASVEESMGRRGSQAS